eukprot:166208_1
MSAGVTMMTSGVTVMPMGIAVMSTGVAMMSSAVATMASRSIAAAVTVAASAAVSLMVQQLSTLSFSDIIIVIIDIIRVHTQQTSRLFILRCKACWCRQAQNQSECEKFHLAEICKYQKYSEKHDEILREDFLILTGKRYP